MLASWVVLTLVVRYNVAFLGEEGTTLAFDGGGAPLRGANNVPPAKQNPSFQLAAWTTVQFRNLRVAVTVVLLLLECALHSTLPPVTAAIVHAFKEYCGGGGGGGAWGGSADFAVLAVRYIFAFHLTMGVQLGCYNQHDVGWGMWQSMG